MVSPDLVDLVADKRCAHAIGGPACEFVEEGIGSHAGLYSAALRPPLPFPVRKNLGPQLLPGFGQPLFDDR